MSRKSAGILVYRVRNDTVEVFLVHPGGPFWQAKDQGAWSVPKGEFAADEQPLQAAIREFREETGLDIKGNFLPLGELKQPGGKIVYVWAVEGDCDPSGIRSNTFKIEWPKGSGKTQEFPEVDRAVWFDCRTAQEKLHKGQAAVIDRLLRAIGKDPAAGGAPAVCRWKLT